MAKLKIVDPDAPDHEISMGVALQSAINQCIADNPNVVLLVWETKGHMTTRAFPDSVMVQKGFVHTLNEMLFTHPDDDAADD